MNYRSERWNGAEVVRGGHSLTVTRAILSISLSIFPSLVSLHTMLMARRDYEPHHRWFYQRDLNIEGSENKLSGETTMLYESVSHN